MDGEEGIPMKDDVGSALKETEIRPDHLMEGQAERFANDIRRMLRRRDEFVSVPCPACAANVSEPAFRKYELEYVRCAECATLYINPRPSLAVLAEYYAKSENYAYWNKYIFPASEKARREKIFKPRVARVLEICRRYGIGGDVLLEVGAGFGIFCEEMTKAAAFKRIIGVEPTPELARTCRERGLEIVEQPIEEVRLDTAVDVVASFEVIEHLFSPRDFILQSRALLKDNGLLVLTCPNGQGFDVEVLQAVSDTVDVEHLNYFNPRSLSRLVETCGFEVLEVSTPGKLDAELVRKKAVSGQFDLNAIPFLRQVLLERWDELGGDFQEFLAAHGLSSHMWLVAKRRE
jgi:2-polyprenyl-3-methyl-5-hydroxy-6-metoxy-1,4-benzoquinol methylase